MQIARIVRSEGKPESGVYKCQVEQLPGPGLAAGGSNGGNFLLKGKAAWDNPVDLYLANWELCSGAEFPYVVLPCFAVFSRQLTSYGPKNSVGLTLHGSLPFPTP